MASIIRVRRLGSIGPGQLATRGDGRGRCGRNGRSGASVGRPGSRPKRCRASVHHERSSWSEAARVRYLGCGGGAGSRRQGCGEVSHRLHVSEAKQPHGSQRPNNERPKTDTDRHASFDRYGTPGQPAPEHNFGVQRRTNERTNVVGRLKGSLQGQPAANLATMIRVCLRALPLYSRFRPVPGCARAYPRSTAPDPHTLFRHPIQGATGRGGPSLPLAKAGFVGSGRELANCDDCCC